MSIIDSAAQRAAWIAGLSYVVRLIQDLQHALDVAMLAANTRQAMHLLAEADVHLAEAVQALDEANQRIARLP